MKANWIAKWKMRVWLSMAVLVFFMPIEAMCNSYKEVSLDRKVEISELVVIAKVVSVSSVACGEKVSCAVVHVSDVLKGRAPPEIVVIFEGPIAELNPPCCEIGSTYLFFLRGDGRGHFESVNGPYGVYEISSD